MPVKISWQHPKARVESRNERNYRIAQFSEYWSNQRPSCYYSAGICAVPICWHSRARVFASTSGNISECSIGQSNPEFKKFIGYAIRSLAEVVTCLHKAKRREYILEQENVEYNKKIAIPWSDDEVQYLLDNDELPRAILANKLERSLTSVKKKIWRFE